MLLIRSLILCLSLSCAIFSETLTIHGRVINSDSTPISRATIKLEQSGFTDTTDKNGYFTLSGRVNIAPSVTPQKKMVTGKIKNGRLAITLPEKSLVIITIFKHDGTPLTTVRKVAESGKQMVDLPLCPVGIHFCRIETGSAASLFKYNSQTGYSSATIPAPPSHIGRNRILQAHPLCGFSDLMTVTKPGYLVYRMTQRGHDTDMVTASLIPCADSVTDIDGNSYQAVKLGNQIWTVENLKTTRFNDGTPIPYITEINQWGSQTAPAYCWYNNDSGSHKKTYGALYNWYSALSKKIAPPGWHVGSNAEWDTLQNYLVTQGFNWDETRSDNKIAKSLAAQIIWDSSATTGSIGNGINQNNKSGFSALPGGYRSPNGKFYELRGHGYFWGTTPVDSLNANTHNLHFDQGYIYTGTHLKNMGRSIRLIKDKPLIIK